MANPRQRRKARSSTHRPVRSTNAKNLRKHPAIKGPKILQDAWDKKKTVRQNYSALGLLPRLSATSGIGLRDERSADDSEADAEMEEAPPQPQRPKASTSTSSGDKTLPKGTGRIVRDSAGNVVSVVLEDEDESDAKADESAWMERLEPMPDHAPVAPVEAKTDVVRALERLSASTTKKNRYASSHEVTWLAMLVEAHGEDVEAMARDIKRNVWQKTPGELRRAISKAGGFLKIRGEFLGA